MRQALRRIAACVFLVALLTSAAMPAAAAAPAFSDVPAGSWAAPDIARCVELGLFQGETATRFGMGHSMTRGAFAVVLCRFFNWPLTAPDAPTYTDVQDPARWYYTAVETAYAHGAVTRQTDTFRPGDAITREEMAVMLMRALGYGTIAGLAQDLPMPFTDVETGGGYLSMAYELGVVSGTSATTFSPDRAATREQAAVILMRLYDRIHGAVPALTGITDVSRQGGDWTGFAAVAVLGGRLSATAQVFLPDGESAAAQQATIRAAGAAALLHVTGAASVLRVKSADLAEAVAAAAESGGYDGVFLDLPALPDDSRQALTDLVQALRARLGDGLLYVAAEAPAWQGTQYAAYDYGALGRSADQLVLRVADRTPEDGSGNFPTAPRAPLEEVYYALAELKGTVAAERTTLLLPTTGAVWENGAAAGTADAAKLAGLLGDSGTTRYYSSRYACAYLSRTESSGVHTVIWYLDAQAAAERSRLCALFGVGQLCLEDLASATSELLAALA